jgi:hypothetical protein
MAVLKYNFDFKHLLIGAEGAKTPGGSPDAQDRIRSLKKLALELFHNSSPGKRSAWSGNQQTSLRQPNEHIAFRQIDVQLSILFNKEHDSSTRKNLLIIRGQ